MELAILVMAGLNVLHVAEFVSRVVQGIADQPSFTLIEGAGHFVSDEQPEVLARTLLDFFKQ